MPEADLDDLNGRKRQQCYLTSSLDDTTVHDAYADLRCLENHPHQSLSHMLGRIQPNTPVPCAFWEKVLGVSI